ncbi:S8 family peptidase [Algivirga pacifica]|uniref:Peptidase S8/S53 domain-containing protein n=1 Tax=Algivirga pacifica TaxID=1162670 RepID=A0ABP9DCF4_9BACT
MRYQYLFFVLAALLLSVYAKAQEPENDRLFLIQSEQVDTLTTGRVLRKLSGNRYLVRDTTFSGKEMSPNRYKLSRKLSQKKKVLEEGWYRLSLKVNTPALLQQDTLCQRHVKVLYTSADGRYMTVEAKRETIEKLEDHIAIDYIDLQTTHRQEEATLRRYNLSINEIANTQAQYGMYGTVVSLKEQAFREEDIDLKGIALLTPLSHSQKTLHATEMATMIAGKGVSSRLGKGISNAKVLSVSYENLFPESITFFEENNIRVQNHSFGTNIENYYGNEAAAYDAHIVAHPEVLHVFSSGNAGLQQLEEMPFAQGPGFGTLTGNFKQAKNILVVGACDSLKVVKSYSSKGPAKDGRIKPELLAYGGEGSSDASAMVSGIASYLQGYAQSYFGHHLRSDLMKALLISTAEDLYTEGPDYYSGYGNVRLRAALESLKEEYWTMGVLEPQAEESWSIQVPDSSSKLTVTLVWNDPAAQPEDYKALVNDLNIRLIHEATGAIYYPWVLNPGQLSEPAHRGVDALNNVEQVSLQYPLEGTYRIAVDGDNIKEAQSFSIAYSLERQDTFEWIYPHINTKLVSGQELSLQWFTTYEKEKGMQLEKSWNEEPWEEVNAMLPVGTSQFNMPIEGEGILRLRARIGEHEYETASIIVTSPIAINTTLNCEDKFTLRWNTVNGAAGYQLYQEGIKDTLLSATDTIITLSKASYENPYYAVAPVLQQGAEGRRSDTQDYRQQGVGCYLDNFLGKLNEWEQASLQLKINGLAEIDQVIVYKQYGTEQTQLLALDQIESGVIDILDQKLRPGVSRYFATVTLMDATTFYSDTVNIPFTNATTTLLYPNPVTDAYINILQPTTGSELLLYTLEGILLLRQPLYGKENIVDLQGVPSGLLLYRIVQEDQVLKQGKLVVN